MKESYFQPILVVQSFKISDSLMASSRLCYTYWCSPNGLPSESCPANQVCPQNCYACGGIDLSGSGWKRDYFNYGAQ